MIPSPIRFALLLLLAVAGLSCATAPTAQQDRLRYTFFNPILPSPSQDPWMIFDGGRYLYCEARETAIIIRTAKQIIDVSQDPGRVVWRAPSTGPCSREIWAPELHHIGGRWYIYFAADDGRNEHHRMWVIEAESLFGPYSAPTALETGGWAIDGTVVADSGRGSYFVWSGWPGSVDGQQNLYIARMSSPVALEGPRALLTAPSEAWERNAMPLSEAPEAVWHNGRLSILYSASGSWTRYYCLGILVFKGGDPMDRGAWIKRGPVFASTDSVWGVGHCSVVPSPDGRETWLLYHAKEKAENGWDDRSVRAQKIGWNADGTPDPGKPLPVGRPIPAPSGAEP